MAMNKVVLAALIKTKVEAATGNPMPPLAVNIWAAIADAIIEHITTAGVVTVVSVSGVTPGVGVSGPGAGVIT